MLEYICSAEMIKNDNFVSQDILPKTVVLTKYTHSKILCHFVSRSENGELL